MNCLSHIRISWRQWMCSSSYFEFMIFWKRRHWHSKALSILRATLKLDQFLILNRDLLWLSQNILLNLFDLYHIINWQLFIDIVKHVLAIYTFITTMFAGLRLAIDVVFALLLLLFSWRLVITFLILYLYQLIRWVAAANIRKRLVEKNWRIICSNRCFSPVVFGIFIKIITAFLIGGHIQTFIKFILVSQIDLPTDVANIGL